MVENQQGTAERQHGTGKPGRTRRIIPRFTIGLRFVSFVILVALLAGGIAGLVTINTSRGSIRQNILNNNLAQADLAAAFASNYVKAIQASVRSFSARSSVVQAVLSNTPENLQVELSQFVQIQVALEGTGIYDAKGIQRVNSTATPTTIGQSFADREWFQQVVATTQPSLSVPVKSRVTGNSIAPYAVPILDEQGQLRGVVTAGISLATLSDAIVNIEYGTGTRASMIDIRNGGLIIADKDPQLLITPVLEKNEAISRLLAGERGAMETTGSSGEKELVSFAPVPDLPWGVMVSTPSKTALAIVQTLTQQASLFTGLIILFAAILGGVFVLQITRPVSRLVAGTKEIGRGNLDYKVATSSRDEIGDLSRAFGDMTEKLKTTLVSRDELAKEVTERVQAEKVTTESEERYRTLFESAVEGILIADLTTMQFKYANPSICKMLGYTKEELIKMNVKYIHPMDTLEATLTAFGALARGEMKTITVPCLRRDGNIIFAEISGVKAIIDGRECNVGFFNDITERKLLEQEREKYTKELAEKNAELERFTYTVSHDLKSPLVTVKTFLGYLQQDITASDTGRIEQDMLYMNGAADKMGKLLEELLEMSRIGRMVNPAVSVTFQELVQETLNLVAGRIEERGVKVQVGDEPLTLYGDRPRLVEIWQNLVENAVKFMGDQPSPRIDIGVEHRGNETVFFVRDNGIGIDPQYQPKIFNLFEKLNPRSEGTGMGLAITKRIVELYKGKIWAESKGPGEGTCFRFTLPGALIDKSKGGQS